MNLKALALKFVMAKLASEKTDKGELSFEGELAVGTEVFVANEAGEPEAAPDGEYTAEDGKVIVVADGKVTEIRDAEPEPAQEPEPEPAQAEPAALSAHNAKRIAAAESYTEIMRKIAEAVGGDAWVVEAGDGWAVVSIWDEETNKEKFIRYAISVDADGNVTLGDSEEVFPRFVSEEEKANLKFETQEEIDAMRAELDELRAENADLKQKLEEKDALVKELEEKASKPAEEPASVAASKQERKKGALHLACMN